MNTKEFKPVSANNSDANGKKFLSLAKLNIEPIEVIEPYNPQIVEFENVDDFNIYYSTHKEEFNNMTTQKLNTKYKIPGYRLTKKSNDLKLIKDYYKRKEQTKNNDIKSNHNDENYSMLDIKAIIDRITFIEEQIDNINAFLSNM